jgi:hypothetical protein
VSSGLGNQTQIGNVDSFAQSRFVWGIKDGIEWDLGENFV